MARHRQAQGYRRLAIPVALALLAMSAVVAASGQTSDAELDVFRKAVINSPQSSLLHFRIGEALLQRGQYQPAVIEFNLALQGDHQPAWTEVWSHVDMGRAFDLVNDRNRALSEYQIAWAMQDDTFSGAAWARNGLIGPAAPGDSFPIRIPSNLDDLISPVITSRTEPEYSEEARMAGLQGVVFLSVMVGTDGAPLEFTVTGPLGLGLDEAAIAAARQWKYRPGMLRGEIVPQVVRTQIYFHLPDAPGWRAQRIEFTMDDGVRRPMLKSIGSPIAPQPSAAEALQMNSAMNRAASITLSFEIGKDGVPARPQAVSSTNQVWVADAAAFVSAWRFQPARNVDGPVAVRCLVTLYRSR